MGGFIRGIINELKLNVASRKDKQYKDFKALYFIRYNSILSVVAALGSIVWIFRDLIVGVSERSYIVAFRAVPLFLCTLSILSLVKRKYKYSWWITFFNIWITIICNILMYRFTGYNEGSLGEGWIVYYLFFFALSISATGQIASYLSVLGYTILLIFTSTEYGGYIVYTIPIMKTIVTAAIIMFGLWIPGVLIRQVFYKLYEADRNIKSAFKIDTQTSLYNRKKLDDILYKGEFFKGLTTVMVIDIDGLKKINDKFGHSEADDVLSFCAHTISKCIRPIDTLIRYEGDEFIIVLSGVFGTENLYKAIQGSLNTSDNKYGVTVSAGSFQCIDDLRAFSAIKKAYIALRVSKLRGKNCLTTFSQVLSKEYDASNEMDIKYLKAIEEAEHITV